MVALRLWFALGNVLARPRDRQSASAGNPPVRGLVLRPAIAAFAGAVLGCLTTLYLCAFGIAPGIASALATSLICGQVLIMRASHLLPADFFIDVYGGSFVGMTPLLWLYDSAADRQLMLASALFISLSVVSGLVFGLVAEIDARRDRRFASGFGGRSGAIAALSSLLFVAAAPLFGAEDRLFHNLPGEALELDLTSASLILTACAVGLFATLTMLRWRSTVTANQAERTFVASAIALIGMASLYLSNPGDVRLLDAFYAGCFLGMSAPERLGGWSAPFLGALVLAIMLVLVRAFLPGIGGSLGLAAFVTVMILAAFRKRPAVRSRATKQGSLARSKLRRQTGMIAYPVSGVLALCCFVLLLSARQQPPLDRATTAEAAMAPSPVALAAGHQASDAPPLEGLAAGSVDLAISLDLPQGDQRLTRARSEDLAPPPPEPSVVSAVRQAAGAVLSDAPAPDREVADDANADERLFREFMRWRAAQGAGIQPRPQPARTRTRPTQVVGLATPVPPRPARPKPVSSVDPTGWPASLRPTRPPKDASRDPSRAAHNATTHPAP